MKKTLKEKTLTFFHLLVKNTIFRFLSDKQFIIWDYFIFLKKFPDLENPKSFSEKIQWIKLNGHLERFMKYVDKLAIREYIGKTIGEEYLVQLIGAWENFEEIPFEKLPNKFVFKATHGSHYLYICKDKNSLDKNKLKKIVSRWLKENFYIKTREPQYKYIKPMIICEKYLEDESGSLRDYKIFCFNGNPYIIEVLSDRFGQIKYDPMDLKWNKLPISAPGYSPSVNGVNKPKNLDEMISLSKKLSHQFPFVRVDFYSVKDKVYFGELTFTQGNGLDKYDQPEFDFELGKFLDLNKYN